jgi:hypothetical protein
MSLRPRREGQPDRQSCPGSGLCVTDRIAAGHHVLIGLEERDVFDTPDVSPPPGSSNVASALINAFEGGRGVARPCAEAGGVP